VEELERLRGALADRYRIERELGRGGMATVYLARDLKHDRDVALKVLHPELGAVIGSERFLAEIKVTARLQHPHILGLIDSGEADRLLFYVMPFVSGESLRTRLQREKQLPLADALRIATEAASALDYAHRQGVVHRDIKPENVLLHDGQALVADFGIALALTSAGGRMTQTGMSLGTPHYMSPEQAMGEREISAKSDVYALGAMTYEMLTGDPPFTGSTSQAILAKVMTEKPVPPSRVRDTVSPQVEVAVLTALAKLPADRWGSAKEFSEALAGRGSAAVWQTGRGEAVTAAPPHRRPVALLFGAPALLIAGVALGWLLHRTPAPRTIPMEFYVEPDSSHTMELGTFVPLALSPDGSRLAYLGRTREGVVQLYERKLSDREVRLIGGTTGADHPFYSPDGEWIAYDDGGELKKIRVAGGTPTTIARIQGNSTGGAWGPDGTIVFASGSPRRIFRVSADGGTPEQVTTADTGSIQNHVRPSFLPGGKTVLFTSLEAAMAPARLGVLSLDTKRVEFRNLPALIPKYISSGELLYVLEDGSLVAQHFDLKRHEVSGPVRRVAEAIASFARIAPTFDASYSGVIAYRPGGGSNSVLVSVDRAGKEQRLFDTPDLWAPRYSPSGDRIAFARSGSSAGGRDIWVYSVSEATSTRITTGFFNAVDPAWSPDGRRLVFSAGGQSSIDLYTAPAGGGESPTRILERPGNQYQATFTRDGTGVVFIESLTAGADLFHAPLVPGGPVMPIVQTSFEERSPALSPDGKWLAYDSNENGAYEVYVRAFPGPGPRAVISSGGGREPVWALSGREIFYRLGGRLIAAAVATGAAITVKSRTVLFDRDYLAGRGNRNYDVHPDGSHFLFIKTTAQQRLVVRLNAFAPEPR